MKKIGIIGGLSAQSTIEYYSILVDEYNKLKGGNSSPELVIDSLDLQVVSTHMLNNEWAIVQSILEKSIDALIAAGAEVLILATNSPHKVYNQLIKKVSIPFLSIMDATAQAIKRKGLKKVGLIGTRFTMQSDFYAKALAEYNIEVLVPNSEDQKIIDDIIWKELTFHILTEESKQKYLEVINNLQAKGAEGVILGCTEIPLLVKQKDCQIPTFDTTDLHAKGILKIALEDRT